MINDEKPNAPSAGWQHLAATRPLSNKWWAIRQDRVALPDKQEIDFTYIEHAGAVFILPITPERKIILIHQYRYTVDRWCWEIIAGGMHDKPGITAEDAAREELAEEIGGRAGKLVPLGTYHAAIGIANLTHHYFLALDTVCDQTRTPEATETIDQIEQFSLEEAVKMAKKGDLTTADTALGIFLAESHFSKI